MERFELYLLLIAGLALLPVYIVKRGEPTITRQKALDISNEYGKTSRFLISNFWVLHLINTAISSISLIILIENWGNKFSILNVMLIVIFIATTIFSALIVSLPSYFIVKHWKRNP